MPQSHEGGNADLVNEPSSAAEEKENAMPQSPNRGNADLVNEPSSATEEKENAMPQSPKRGNADLVNEPSSAAEGKDNAMPQSPKRGSTDSEGKNLQPDFRKGGRDDESEKNHNNRGRQSEGYRRGQVFALSVE